MTTQNKAMKNYLKKNGIDAMPKYLSTGSLKGTWRLYAKDVKWWDNFELQNKLTKLGFLDFDGDALSNLSGNGGMFSIFARFTKGAAYYD